MNLRSILRVRSITAFVAASLLAANGVSAEVFYVSSDGYDVTSRDGKTLSTAWQTVAYAASKVTQRGDTIQVGAGIFAETAQINLAPGVHLTGQGQALTTITTVVNNKPAAGTVGPTLLSLRSEQMTDGEQTISKLTFDGNNHAAQLAVHVRRRHKVTIHDITIRDCFAHGLKVDGIGIPNTYKWPTAMPPDSFFMAELKVYDSTFQNTGLIFDNRTSAWGAITIYQLRDSEIRNCTFDESTYGGFNVKGEWGVRLHIHDNLWRVPDYLEGANTFSFEFWFLEDSNIHHNRANGAFSIFASNSQIRDNEIVVSPNGGSRFGIEIMGRNTRVHHNYVQGAVPGIVCWSEAQPGLYIENNVLRGGGILISAGQKRNNPADYETSKPLYAFKEIFILNNTIDLAKTVYNQGAAIGARIQFPNGSIDGLTICNNIISNPVGIKAISLTGANGGNDANVKNITNTVISHNLLFNAVAPEINDLGSTTPLIDPVSNLKGLDPQYADGKLPSPFYRLQPASPAINRGMNVGLSFVGAAPDIGAYETESLTVTRYEAETSYSVPIGFDVGSRPIAVRNRIYDSNTSLSVYDRGDTIRIAFNASVSGVYGLRVRLRSGANGHPQLYWPSGYSFVLDGSTTVNLTKNIASISPFDSSDGGCYWGTMENLAVPLTAGLHTLDIRSEYDWGMIDYLEVIE